MKEGVKLFFIFYLIYGNFLVWPSAIEFLFKYQTKIFFFNSERGESIFIESPFGHQILIDGGSSNKILEKLGKVMPLWDRKIDLVVLTHPHFDHLFGLIEVLKNYKVENILFTGIRRENSFYRKWLNLLKEEKAKIYFAKAGRKIVAEPAKFEFKVLYPFFSLKDKRVKNINDSSVVLKAKFGKIDFLFTGDISKKIERKLILKYPYLKAEILKVAHSGSKTSSSVVFLEKISPKIAVIFASKDNPYGHPHKETLNNLRKFPNIFILITGKKGDIKIFTDGEKIKIR